MAGLAKAAEAVGLQTEGVQVTREALPEVETPAIAWEEPNGGHYVALLRLEGSGEGATAVIKDPNGGGEQTIGQEQLLQRCGGYLLLVRK
jgi:ABC-type bacteriocin/lantibiotic exporter with double-glycine peptidase domain